MRFRKDNRGQTLVIVLVIMFVLVTLGFTVILTLGRELTSTGIAHRRNIANDLAQAGVRYCFGQLRFSEDGADWRPAPPTPVPADINPALPPGLGPNSDPENPSATNPDPDYFWMRRQVIPNNPNATDLGGPDGLGSYTRLNYDDGRTLVRVRYSPSGPELFDPNVSGGVGQRGKFRAYTLIEVVGRPGAFNAQDPTSSRVPNLQAAREMSAIVPIGILENAYYVHNKDRRNQAVDLGNPMDFGSNFMGAVVKTKRQIGGTIVNSPAGVLRTLGGSIYINADVRIFGDLQDQAGASGLEVYLNKDFGDQINVAGNISFAESTAPLRLFSVSGVTVTPFLAGPSTSGNFNTFGGIYRDGNDGTDSQGFPRLVSTKEPPLMDEQDPNTGQLRYRSLTRDSGVIGPGGFNVGRLGYGRNIYINNGSDLNRDSENGNYTQRYDWLNPNAHPDGFWQGPYYIPPAVYIELLPDGFLITRNAKNQRDTWRDYNGRSTGRHTLRYKLGYDTAGVIRIINELSPNINNFGSPTPADFDQGVPFGGVIFAEGNVRIRGIIPVIGQGSTLRGMQLTVVSMGTGYVEGSITKGDPNTSTLALLCKDNVVLNTTQFVQSSVGNTLQIVRDNNDPNSPARLRVDTSRDFDALVQFPNDPLTGNPFVSTYTFTNPNRGNGNPINTSIFLGHAADFDRSTFINLLINPDTTNNPSFLFENINPPNAASQFFAPGNPIGTYGLADVANQVLPIYEKRRFELFPINNNTNGQFTLLTGGMENDLRFKLDNTLAVAGRGDYFFQRISVQPLDIRIEAAMFAQEGSFFVIPGPWMNPDPNDRREVYTTAAERKNNFHASPEYPFNKEPMDIRVTVIGSVSENFPPTMSDQSLWLQHWGWVPAQYGMSGQYVPDQHFPRIPGTNNPDFTNSKYVPNLFINYDPALISGRAGGSFDTNAQIIRLDAYRRPLPPMPKLPVGTKLLYFGEVNP